MPEARTGEYRSPLARVSLQVQRHQEERLGNAGFMAGVTTRSQKAIFADRIKFIPKRRSIFTSRYISPSRRIETARLSDRERKAQGEWAIADSIPRSQPGWNGQFQDLLQLTNFYVSGEHLTDVETRRLGEDESERVSQGDTSGVNLLTVSNGI